MDSGFILPFMELSAVLKSQVLKERPFDLLFRFRGFVCALVCLYTHSLSNLRESTPVLVSIILGGWGPVPPWIELLPLPTSNHVFEGLVYLFRGCYICTKQSRQLLSNCESRLQITCKKFCFPTYCIFFFFLFCTKVFPPPPPTAESVGFIIYDMRCSQGPKLTFFVYLPIVSKLRTFNDRSHFLLNFA